MDHVELELRSDVHVFIDVWFGLWVIVVDHVALVVNEAEVSQFNSIILSVPTSLDAFSAVIQYLNQDVVHIALASPQQLEPVVVVDDCIESEAHANTVEFIILQHVRCEFLMPDIC